VNYYLVRLWSPRRFGVTLATTYKAGFFDPGGWHSLTFPKNLGTGDRQVDFFLQQVFFT
jgi:hypothetical protein